VIPLLKFASSGPSLPKALYRHRKLTLNGVKKFVLHDADPSNLGLTLDIPILTQ
jgi:hypothetical protein